MEAVCFVASYEEACAGVVLVTVGSGAVVQVGRVVAVAVFYEGHDSIGVGFMVGAADEAEVAVEALGVDVGARVGAEIVSAQDDVGCEFGFDFVLFPRCEGAVVGVAEGEVSCVVEAADGRSAFFRDEFGIRVKGGLVVFRDVEDDGIGVLLVDAYLVQDEARVDGFVEAWHHVVGGAVGSKALGVVNDVDVFARAEFGGLLDARLDGGVADVGRVGDGEQGFIGDCVFRDVEVEVLEIVQVLYGVVFGVHVESVVLAGSLAVAAVEAHHGA